MTQKKAQAAKNRQKRNQRMRENKRLAELQNKGLDHKRILSSGRPLPSSHGWQHLATLCEVQHSYVMRMTQERDQKLERIKLQQIKLAEKHKRDPSRLEEVPNSYILPYRLLVLEQRVKAAVENMELLQEQYTRATGGPWKPKPDINKPIEGIAKRK